MICSIGNWSTTKIIQIMTLGDLGLFYSKIKHGNMLEHKISLTVLKTFAQKCSNDDIGLTLTFFGKINMLSGLSHGKALWNL